MCLCIWTNCIWRGVCRISNLQTFLIRSHAHFVFVFIFLPNSNCIWGVFQNVFVYLSKKSVRFAEISSMDLPVLKISQFEQISDIPSDPPSPHCGNPLCSLRRHTWLAPRRQGNEERPSLGGGAWQAPPGYCPWTVYACCVVPDLTGHIIITITTFHNVPRSKISRELGIFFSSSTELF